MNSKIIYKIVAFEGENEIFSEKLSFEILSSIVSRSPYSIDKDPLFRLLAKHPSSMVREEIAGRDEISEEVCELLSKDTSIAVLRNLTRSRAFKEFATFEILEKLIKSSYECAENIADDIESYQLVDTSKLAELILLHEDPQVLLSLARNSSVPKKILKKLEEHEDSAISDAAKNTLYR